MMNPSEYKRLTPKERRLWCERLIQKENLLRSLEALVRKSEGDVNVDEFFRSLVCWSAAQVNGRQACLYLLDRSTDRLLLQAAHGGKPEMQIVSPALFGGDWERLLASEGFCIKPATLLSGLENGNSGGWVVVPLVIRDQLLGVILVEREPGGEYCEVDAGVLLSFIRTAGLTLENNFLYRQIFRGLTETLQFMVSTLEARDLYTKDHSVRVTGLALEIAKNLDCSAEQQEMLDFAGRLHDIGKVGIQDVVLLKAGRLSVDEWSVMRQHPVIGEQIVRPVCLLEDERAIVRHHHEWWNGEGYPDHLLGDDIPLLARILSVADAFDAMTSNRPYRHAMTPDKALSVLKQFAGVQFDPEVVGAFRASAVGAEVAASSVK
jgi:hypothetical protein